MPVHLPPLDFRFPAWDKQNLHLRDCPVCAASSGKAVFVRPDGLTVLCCERCTTFYVSPAPRHEEVDAFYSTYDEAHRRANPIASGEIRDVYYNNSFFDDLRIREVVSYFPLKGKKVLDVGFGRARLLHALKVLGAVPYGVDVDEKAIQYAQALGISNVICGTIDDLDDQTCFDLISMVDLIEHPLEPMRTLTRAVQLLAPQGLLLLWTPNADTVMQEDIPTLFRVDLEHLQYFTPQSLQYIAGQLDVNIIHLESVGFPDFTNIEGHEKKEFHRHLPSFVRSIPGFNALNQMRQEMIIKKMPDGRKGNYHLFCIMRKPAQDKV